MICVVFATVLNCFLIFRLTSTRRSSVTVDTLIIEGMKIRPQQQSVGHEVRALLRVRTDMGGLQNGKRSLASDRAFWWMHGHQNAEGALTESRLCQVFGAVPSSSLRLEVRQRL